MKVAIIMDGLGLGGAERQAVTSAIELRRLGVGAELVYYHPINEYSDMLTRESVPVAEILNRGPLRLGRVRAIAAHLKRGRFDVAYSLQGTSSVWGTISARLAGTRCVFAGFRGQACVGGLSRRVLGVLGRKVTGWIVNAACVRDHIVGTMGADPQKVHIVPNGIAPASYESQLSRAEARRLFDLPDDSVAVGMVANLRPVKNHHMFLRVARRVVQTRPGVVFLAAGDGPMRAELESTASEYGLADRVRFLGRLKNVPDLLAACDLAMLTSVTEGLPNTVAEAQGASLPCVSTANGGAKEVILPGRTGFIVPVDDDVAMADRLVQLIDDPSARSEMGLRAAERIRQQFSPEMLGRRLIDLFERAMRDGRNLVALAEGES